MAHKNGHKAHAAARPRPAIVATAPACRVVHTAEGNRVQRFPTEEEVRLCAFLRWEAAGRPPGDGREFWFEAERQLVGMA